jgi:hypothetical protein
MIMKTTRPTWRRESLIFLANRGLLTSILLQFGLMEYRVTVTMSRRAWVQQSKRTSGSPSQYPLRTDRSVSYVEGAIWKLKSFVEKYGENIRNEVNSVASAHVITMAADDSGKWSYCGVDVHEGKIRILFNPTKIGSNIDDAFTKLEDALNEAPQPEGSGGLSPVSRLEISKEWEPKAEGIRKKFADMFQVPDFKIDPGFEGAYAMLKNGGKDVRDDWETRLGYATKEYFESVEWTLKSQKFGEEYMQSTHPFLLPILIQRVVKC